MCLDITQQSRHNKLLILLSKTGEKNLEKKKEIGQNHRHSSLKICTVKDVLVQAINAYGEVYLQLYFPASLSPIKRFDRRLIWPHSLS